MSKTRRGDVEAAIAEIRTFHALGLRLREQHERDQDSTKAKSSGDSIHVETVRKARQFADPVNGYSPAQLADLCRLIRRTQPDQDDTKSIFGPTHVKLMLTVKGARRAQLQRKAVKGGWSVRDLKEEIKAKQGTLREGGRRRRLPTNRAGLLDELESECERWRRLKIALSREDGSGRESAPQAVLGDNLMKRFRVVSNAIQDLQQAVTNALSIMHPRRELRLSFQGGETGSGRKGDDKKQPHKKRLK